MHLHNSTPAPIFKTLNRHHILSLIAGQYLTVKQAAKELNLSVRQTMRLWRLYRDGNGDPDSLAPRPHVRLSPMLTDEVRQRSLISPRTTPTGHACTLRSD